MERNSLLLKWFHDIHLTLTSIRLLVTLLRHSLVGYLLWPSCVALTVADGLTHYCKSFFHSQNLSHQVELKVWMLLIYLSLVLGACIIESLIWIASNCTLLFGFN